MNTQKIFLGSLLLGLALFMNSCKDDYSVDIAPGPGVTPQATFTPEGDISIGGSGGSSTIQVVSNMPDSTISAALNYATTGESWCTTKIVDNKVTLTVAQNTSYSPRAATLKIKAFTLLKTFAVEQDGKDYVIDVTYPYSKNYKINIPSVSDFNNAKTNIFAVMDGSQKIAEICLEYINATGMSSRAIVVYGVAARDGNSADYKNGYIAQFIDDSGNVKQSNANGSAASFNYDTNECSYIPILRNFPTINTVYLSTTGVTNKEIAGATELTAQPYYVTDKSGNQYPVVKVGADVWLGSNLRTLKMGDGTNITLTNTPAANCAVYPRQDTSLDPATFGYLYHASLVTGGNVANMGASIVDGYNSTWRISTAGGSNASGIMGTTTDWQRLFKYIGKDQLGAILSKEYHWSGGSAGGFDPSTVTNITGMSIPAAGEIYSMSFALAGDSQAFFVCQGGQGYNFCEADGKALDQVGVRVWPHNADACSVRLVRVDSHNLQ